MLKRLRPKNLQKDTEKFQKNTTDAEATTTALEHLLAINHEIEKLKKLQLIL